MLTVIKTFGLGPPDEEDNFGGRLGLGPGGGLGPQLGLGLGPGGGFGRHSENPNDFGKGIMICKRQTLINGKDIDEPESDEDDVDSLTSDDLDAEVDDDQAYSPEDYIPLRPHNRNNFGKTIIIKRSWN